MKKMPIYCFENCSDYLCCGEDVESPDDCGGFSWNDVSIDQMPRKSRIAF
jgi:hypothetical protein